MTRIVTVHGAMSGLKAHRAAGQSLCSDCAAYLEQWLEAHGWGQLDLRPCGTPAALRRHERRGEPIDETCRKAEARYRQDLQARKGANA